MNNLTLEVKELKKGFRYTVKDGDKVLDTRKSNRVYVAASVFYSPEDPASHLRPFYHGNINLVGKGDGAYYIKKGYKYRVATIH